MKTIIIAEAGVNHNGDFDTAARLVTAAARTEADYIKFQTFKAEKLSTVAAEQAEYQKKNLGDGDSSQFTMLKKLELPEEWHHRLFKLCKSNGIKFLSSAFDCESIDFLDEIGVDCFKIPSGEITNLPYLRKVATKGKSVLLSTGMATLEEVGWALRLLIKNGLSKKDIILLHCNTEYPTPFRDVNLKAMLSMRDQFKVKVGYSDHTEGITVPVAAVAFGACVIEKHFTLNKAMPGPDHKASLEPQEFEKMVRSIREVEMALSGNGIKKPSRSELKNIEIVRKSIVASKYIRKGEIFTEENITAKRPANGISPVYWDRIIGKKAKIDFNPDDLIKL